MRQLTIDGLLQLWSSISDSAGWLRAATALGAAASFWSYMLLRCKGREHCKHQQVKSGSKTTGQKPNTGLRLPGSVREQKNLAKLL